MDVYQLFQEAEKLIDINARPHVYLEQFHAAPRILADIYTVYAVNNYIRGDGLFDGVFASQLGLVVPEAIQGFQHLQMPNTANVLSRAASKLGLPYPRGFVLRQKRLERLLGQIPHEAAQAWFGWTAQEITEDLDGFETMKAQLVFEDEDNEYFNFIESENGGFKQAIEIYAADFLQNQSAQ
jgi:hypothetical protein